jgi:hypothetical protein
MAATVVALMVAACGGTVEESTDVQAQHANIDPVAGASLNIGGGGPCGDNYCGKDSFCCNASCGICAPLGGGCPDVMCDVAQPPEEKHQLIPPDCGGECPAGTYCCSEGRCCTIK